MSIVVVGSVAYDGVETPHGKVERMLGGSCTNIALSASYFSPVKIVGVMGDDFAQEDTDLLASRGVDLDGLERTPGKTFFWKGVYSADMNDRETLVTDLNVFEHFDPTLAEHHKDAELVFLANIDPVLQQKVLDQVRKPKLVACDSMNFWITGKPDELKKTLKRVDILSINEGEAFLLSGEKNLVKAAAIIKTMGPSVVIVKRGEYGAMLFGPDSIFLAPAFPVDFVIDPTGAGDSFAGGFMGFLASQNADREMAKSNPAAWDSLLRRAVLAGCTMASFTVQDFSLHRLMKLEGHDLATRQSQLMKMVTL